MRAACPVRFLLKANLPLLPLMSHSYTRSRRVVDFHTGWEGVCVCARTHQWVCVSEREREIETGMTWRRLKTERKHSPTLSSY